MVALKYPLKANTRRWNYPFVFCCATRTQVVSKVFLAPRPPLLAMNYSLRTLKTYCPSSDFARISSRQRKQHTTNVPRPNRQSVTRVTFFLTEMMHRNIMRSITDQRDDRIMSLCRCKARYVFDHQCITRFTQLARYLFLSPRKAHSH